jgi:hypothetical protein
MYVSIDMENMRFVHKHTEHKVVSMLSWIELAHVHCRVQPLDHTRDFCGLTDLELFSLYRSHTGVAPGGYGSEGLRVLCLEAARMLPESDASSWELEIQLRGIPDDDRGRYRYVKGSMTPAPVDELFEVPVHRVTVAPQVVAGARTATPAPVPHTPIPLPPGRDRTPGAPVVPRAPPAAPTARGAGREKIWAVADRMWEAAGKPMAVATVLDLRKKMMDVLEAEGTKRTSASSELGNWMKARVLAK